MILELDSLIQDMYKNLRIDSFNKNCKIKIINYLKLLLSI